jgi:hypothetical protein
MCCFHPRRSTHIQNRTPWQRVQKPRCQTTGLKSARKRHALTHVLVFVQNVNLTQYKTLLFTVSWVMMPPSLSYMWQCFMGSEQCYQEDVKLPQWSEQCYQEDVKLPQWSEQCYQEDVRLPQWSEQCYQEDVKLPQWCCWGFGSSGT